jgi:hypothetical protein
VPPHGCRSTLPFSPMATRRTRARAHRRLDRQGAHETGIGLQFGVADPAVADRMIGGDQRVELARQRVLLDC